MPLQENEFRIPAVKITRLKPVPPGWFMMISTHYQKNTDYHVMFPQAGRHRFSNHKKNGQS